MKKLLVSFALCSFCLFGYSQDSMNKKMENKSDKMNKKMENKSDKMNKKIGNTADSTKMNLNRKSDTSMHRARKAKATKL